MLPYSVTVKYKSRLNKGDEEWQSIATSSFSTKQKANTFQYNTRFKYRGYDGKVEITDNYSNNDTSTPNE